MIYIYKEWSGFYRSAFKKGHVLPSSCTASIFRCPLWRKLPVAKHFFDFRIFRTADLVIAFSVPGCDRLQQKITAEKNIFSSSFVDVQLWQVVSDNTSLYKLFKHRVMSYSIPVNCKIQAQSDFQSACKVSLNP